MNNEFEWIKSVSQPSYRHSSVKVGVGDDAAIYEPQKGYEQVVTVDTMVEGVHFKKETVPAKATGYKALAVNLSDIAAMGGRPLYYLVSIAVPKRGWTQEELREIYEGMHELSEKWHVDLIGGDTVSTDDALVITVTVIGEIKSGRRLLRSNAKAGDVLFITGAAGSSAYGLEKLLEQGLKAADDPSLKPFLKAHQEPEPQLQAGMLLAEAGCRLSLNDVSDGLAHEAKEIAEASGIDVIIDWNRLPIHESFKEYSLEKQESWVLYGGEDFQLTGTVSPEDWESLSRLFSSKGLPLFRIGSVEPGSGKVYIEREGKKILADKQGYHHF
ncbi:thiamine-phosphate kinase [Salipaludibacillus aurantiacus]|uniref:Thiamine-monophosphate kinase n=1 Tax=Salipaludibacillus aurantiacus TaxID=1601833 RepID=A0A1H9U1J3_9BACI|nr:thiamine-phosphate kinase [Salipaludibacillus aurantiacus]SES03480.1 thiamine-monophosphate kinase [Salipaludibacillus aurantiacus]